MATSSFASDGYSTTATSQISDGAWPISPPDGPIYAAGEPVDRPVDSQVVMDPSGTRLSDQGHPANPKPKKKSRRRIKIVLISVAAISILAVVGRYSWPMIREALDTVSTDDAFVSSHLTNVSPRIEGLVTGVFVDQNDRVEPGTLLFKLDPEPYEIAVAQAEATVQVSRSRLADAHAQVKSQLAQARGNFFRRKNAQEQLRRQVAALQAEVATLRARESSLRLAEVDHQRLANLVGKGSASQSELDQRNNTLDVAREQVKEAWAAIQETRVSLGLLPNTQNPLDLPKDLEQKQSTVQSAVSEISSALAQVGIAFDSQDLEQGAAYEKLIGLDSSRGIEEAQAILVEKAPAVQVARASVTQSQRQLDDARRKLRYTEVRSEISGYVEDRSVHPGNRVEPGQSLLSVRPDYVWIDANFKETQLKDIRIGQPVELFVDAYPRHIFRGRVAGFRSGTGLASSLLPPENATGNYVKVVQRLPIRIELTQPNPKDTPLFAGLSVVPHVRIKDRPTGPNAGKRLRVDGQNALPDLGAGPASVGRQARLDGQRDTTWPR